MTVQAHTYQRVIEDAVVTLLTAATTTVNQAYKDIRDADYYPQFRRAYEGNKDVSELDVVVHAMDFTNAMLGATGRGSQWRVTLVISVINSIDHDKANGNADQVQGAVERWLYAATPATINNQLSTTWGANQPLLIDGITGAEVPDSKAEERQALARASAVTLHFTAPYTAPT